MKGKYILSIGSLLFFITAITLSISKYKNSQTDSEIEKQKRQSDIDFYLMAGLVLGTGSIVVQEINN